MVGDDVGNVEGTYAPVVGRKNWGYQTISFSLGLEPGWASFYEALDLNMIKYFFFIKAMRSLARAHPSNAMC